MNTLSVFLCFLCLLFPSQVPVMSLKALMQPNQAIKNDEEPRTRLLRIYVTSAHQVI